MCSFQIVDDTVAAVDVAMTVKFVQRLWSYDNKALYKYIIIITSGSKSGISRYFAVLFLLLLVVMVMLALMSSS